MPHPFTKDDAGVHTFTDVSLANDTGTLTFPSRLASFAAHRDLHSFPTRRSSDLTGFASVTVQPAAAAHFQVDAPSSAHAGARFSITVTALDQFGNTDYNY